MAARLFVLTYICKYTNCFHSALRSMQQISDLVPTRNGAWKNPVPALTISVVSRTRDIPWLRSAP